MSKSYWLEEQKGNFSKEGKDTFDPRKRYVGIRLQQGVPLLDRDWNELEDIRRYEELMLRKWYVGNGTPDDGFKISAAGPRAKNNFKIEAGRCIVDGFDVVNDKDILYSKQKGVAALTPPSDGVREDTVYLDVWIEEVRSAEDPALKNSQDVNIETCIRHKLEWRVRVDEGSKGDYAEKDRHYYDIAKITREAGRDTILNTDIEDLRRTGLGRDIAIGDNKHRAGKIRFWQEPNSEDDHVSHAIGTESFHNIYGAGKKYANSIGHRFYRGGGELIAHIGFGGKGEPGNRLNSYFAGNVGIGTTEPKAKLDVKGAIRAGNSDLYFTKTDHNHTRIGNIKGYAAIENAKDNGALMIFGRTMGTGNDLRRTVKLWDYLQVNGRMAITGKVGIGTTEPNTKLHILGGKDASLKNDSGFLVVGSIVRTNIVMDDNEIMARNNGKKSALHLQAEGGDLILHNLQDGSAKFIIKDSGNVGIGTMNPEAKLDVKGAIRAGNSDLYFTKTDHNHTRIGNIKGYAAIENAKDNGALMIFGRTMGTGNDLRRTVKLWDILKIYGTLNVTGAKQFLIDHPLDSEHKNLLHATLEGPEVAVFYRGEAQLSNGHATVQLPDYFEALTRKENRTVLLTSKFEADAPISMLAVSKVKEGRFEVKMIDDKNPSQKFYWEVKAVRADVDILEVEETKTSTSKGVSA